MSRHRTLWLHVGGGKTGTSAIQSGLAINRQILLAEHGIYYPEGKADEAARRGETTGGNGGHLLSFLKKATKSELAFEFLRSAFDRHDNAVAVVFSSEHMGVVNKHKLSELAEFAAKRGWQIRIIYWVRHIVDHAISGSSKSEYIRKKDERTERNSGGYFATYRSPFKDHFATYEEILGVETIRVMIYDEERKDVLGGFVSAIAGQCSASVVRPPPINVSFRGPELAAYRRLVSEFDSGSDRRKMKKIFEDQLCEHAVTKTAKFIIEPAELEHLRRNNGDVLDHFNQTYFDGAERLKLKSDEIMVGQRVHAPVDERDVDQLVQKVKARLHRSRTSAPDEAKSSGRSNKKRSEREAGGSGSVTIIGNNGGFNRRIRRSFQPRWPLGGL